MSTFPDTRYLLLDHASMLASTDGLAGLSAARVARAARLSKATVHGHLGGRERLHLSVLDHAVWELVRDVVIPARRAPRTGAAAGRRCCGAGWHGTATATTRGGPP
ncbi:MAG: TetR family transcriptional regulator [Gemmatimonadetes bacterium]|nr:TetR family transcriptional regulator [Gemmatimonadota bacterium]